MKTEAWYGSDVENGKATQTNKQKKQLVKLTLEIIMSCDLFPCAEPLERS